MVVMGKYMDCGTFRLYRVSQKKVIKINVNISEMSRAFDKIFKT